MPTPSRGSAANDRGFPSKVWGACRPHRTWSGKTPTRVAPAVLCSPSLVTGRPSAPAPEPADLAPGFAAAPAPPAAVAPGPAAVVVVSPGATQLSPAVTL